MYENRERRVGELTEWQKRKLMRKIGFSSAIAGIFFLLLIVHLAISGLQYAHWWLADDGMLDFADSNTCTFFEKIFGIPFRDKYVEVYNDGKWTVTTHYYNTAYIDLFGRFVLINVLNILTCLCFRRGNVTRVSGGNIALYVVGYIVVWGWFVLMDMSWYERLVENKHEDMVSVSVKFNAFLLVYSILSLITLKIIHNNYWFETKDKRLQNCENGKLHPAVCIFAYLFSYSLHISIFIMPITFVVALIYRKVKIDQIRARMDWYNFED